MIDARFKSVFLLILASVLVFDSTLGLLCWGVYMEVRLWRFKWGIFSSEFKYAMLMVEKRNSRLMMNYGRDYYA